MTTYPIAPELQVAAWLHPAQRASEPLSLAALRGKVVALYVFQMLCPGCVSHGIPQAKLIRDSFSADEVAVLGLHSVFEHHDVMTERALQAFMHEYRINFPVAVDLPSASGPVPHTMEQYQLRGTPSLLLIDRAGRLRFSHFGRAGDMQVGALIGRMLAEPLAEALPASTACDEEGCAIGR